MRARLAGIMAMAIAGALVHCSLVVDTDGLTGGSKEAGVTSDAPTNASTEGGLTDGPSSSTDAPIGPGGLGPTWLAYGTGAGKVSIRTWTSNTVRWSSEIAGPDVNGEAVHWVVAKETPVGSFLGIVSEGPSGKRLQIFQHGTDGTWKLGFSQPMAVDDHRAFDIEYETKTNGVVVAYGDTTAHVKSRRFAAGAWSAEADVGPGGSLGPEWIELARNPISDEIALVYADGGSNLFTSYWDGASWQKPIFLDGNLTTIGWKCFDEAYESNTGKLVVAWGHTKPVGGGEDHWMSYAIRQPGAPVFAATQSTADGTPPGSLVMVPEVGTKRIALSFVEYNCNRGNETCDDFGAMIWDGSKFDVDNIDPDTTTLYGDRPSIALTSIAWVGGTGNAVAAYHRTLSSGGSPGQLAFSRYAGTWSNARGADAPPDMEARASMQLVSVSNVQGPQVIAVVEDVTGALWSKVYRETAGGNGNWTDNEGAPIATALLPVKGVPFSVAVP